MNADVDSVRAKVYTAFQIQTLNLAVANVVSHPFPRVMTTRQTIYLLSKLSPNHRNQIHSKNRQKPHIKLNGNGENREREQAKKKTRKLLLIKFIGITH